MEFLDDKTGVTLDLRTKRPDRPACEVSEPDERSTTRDAVIDEVARLIDSIAIDAQGAWVPGVTPREVCEVLANDVRYMKDRVSPAPDQRPSAPNETATTGENAADVQLADQLSLNEVQPNHQPNRVRIVGNGTMGGTRIEDTTTGDMIRFVKSYTVTQRKGEMAHALVEVMLPEIDLECGATIAAAGARFAPGDRVQKVGGSYQATGEIKAAWLADDGTARYVFRFDNPAGMLHIFSDANLELSKPQTTTGDDIPVACQGSGCAAAEINRFAHSTECINEAAASQGWMDFGGAIRALKDGQRVSRRGWNGKGVWLSMSGPSPYRSIPAVAFWSKNNADYALGTIDGCANVLPCITMKTADGAILMGWLASQTDMLAEDWMVVL